MAETFTVKIDGQDVEFKVRRPTAAEQKESEKVYRRVFRECLDNGDFVRAKLNDKLREQGLWDDKKQLQYDMLLRDMADGRKALLKRGIKLSEARKIALSILDKRNELVELHMTRNQLDGLTAEAQAENSKFNYLVSVCVVYNTTQKPYFRNLDDYLEKGITEVAINGANALLRLLDPRFMDTDENEESNSIEAKFLKEFKFVDAEGRLINKDGHLVDRENRLINEQGHYVDANENRVDIDGNPVDEEGNWKFDDLPFLDDDGVPLPAKSETEQSEPVIEEPKEE